MADYEYQSVRNYVTAKQAGDADGAASILREACMRFVAHDADASEIAEFGRASMDVPLGTPQ